MNSGSIEHSASHGIPPGVVAAEDYERLAAQKLEPALLAGFAGGAGQEMTLRANRARFAARQILPRVLADFSHPSTEKRLFGRAHTSPILLAPLAHQGLLHARGELATARGASVVDMTMVVSTLASHSLEDIAAASASRKWFQLYCQPDWAQTLSLVRRAEQSGYEALVVTVDVPVAALRYREQRAGFVMPQGATPNLDDWPVATLPHLVPGQSRILHGVMSLAANWDDVVRLRESTSLPLLIKGVLHPDDALRAQGIGVDGVVVSNHGGRALDGVPASIDMLPLIRDAVGPDYPLLLDSGIRHGMDVFKALASGADAVLVGRLQAWALAVAGPLGVAHMLQLLREEFEVAMALAGCVTLDDISPRCLLQE